jgi:2-(1,2-epoxy-1,2-dihydrophenyl)acetyl-CoA isomerase
MSTDASAPETIDTGTEQLLATRNAGVLTLTLNRPRARNALTSEMIAALAAALTQAEADPRVRCVVLTGASGSFCSGGDVAHMAQGSNDAVSETALDASIAAQRRHQRGTAGQLYSLLKPTLAVLPGAAAGAGFSLALACDLRIMAKTAFLVTAFAQVGLPGDYGGTFFTSRLVGAAKTRELYLLSERVSADQALSLGLTNWVCDSDRLATQAQSIAERLAAGPAIAYRYMKENINRAQSSADWYECLDLEATHHIHCSRTADHREAARAFVEKRKAVFAAHEQPDRLRPDGEIRAARHDPAGDAID